ncbi:MAG: C39 family peptidase, partial [bacterium]|nr:C39 family peptidase [bacterium]
YWNSLWHDLLYEVEMTPLQGVDRNISFGFRTLTNWYEAHFLDEFFNLVRVKDGTVPLNTFTPFAMQNGLTYKIAIKIYQGNISIYVNNALITTKADWSYQDGAGKIGIKLGTGSVFPGKIAFDNVKVTLLNQDILLPVSLVKQDDTLWRDAIYDHATTWSTTPTIGRWGCALTAAVMILQYHKIDVLPNGYPLTPESLNTWLTQQPDGYIGEGLVNWLAITRLTQKVSQQRSTPKLEFRRFQGSSPDKAIEEIDDSKPVILQIPGHFIVGHGYTESKQLLIADPLFSFTKLEQHNKPLLSTSTFQPSQTDLSYLLITHSPSVSLQLLNEAQEVDTRWQQFDDYLATPALGEHSAATTQTISQKLLAKPTAGKYDISISQPQLSTFESSIYSYDEKGTVTTQRIKGTVGASPLTYTFRYQPGEKVTVLQKNITLEHFMEDVELVRKQQGFKKDATYYVLKHIIASARKKSRATQHFAVKILRITLRAHRHHLSKEAYEYLTQQAAVITISTK